MKTLKLKTRSRLLGAAFVLPAVLFIVAFGMIPIISSLRYSFTDWDGVSVTRNIGLENYITAFQDEVNIKAIGNTFILSFSVMFCTITLGYLLANFLSGLRGPVAEAGKVVLFIPHILSFAAVGVLFSFIYSSTNLGLLNKIISLVGLGPHPWLGSAATAMPALVLSHVWKGFGFDFLLYYAGIQTIQQSLLESADIDGASGWQKSIYVKIPCLKPITQLLIVLGFVRMMLTFTMVMFLTPEGGPNKATEVVATWFYKQSFMYWKFGYGAALAIILAVIVMVVTIILRKVFREEV